MSDPSLGAVFQAPAVRLVTRSKVRRLARLGLAAKWQRHATLFVGSGSRSEQTCVRAPSRKETENPVHLAFAPPP
jgi:hypothetical protein